MRTATALLCAALAFAAGPRPTRAQDSGADHWDARLTAVDGDVVVHPAGGGGDVVGEADMPLEEGDRVTTGAGGTAEIALDGDSLITLSANSDFTLKDTRKSASVFELAFGSLLAKIQKLGSQSLEVHSPAAVAAVRGTEFGVDVDAGGANSHVGVFDEGHVDVGGAGGHEMLGPNQETSVARGRAPLRPGALRRFATRRAMMRARVRRLEAVRRAWKPMPAQRRREARARAFQRQRLGGRPGGPGRPTRPGPARPGRRRRPLQRKLQPKRRQP